eukprot:76691_1
MSTYMDNVFRAINIALKPYYHRLGYNYENEFIKFIIDDELNDKEIPIENELGDETDPNDCIYSLMNSDQPFPVPKYIEVPPENKEAFIFYVLQYCYKYNQAPSDQYIKDVLAEKVQARLIPEENAILYADCENVFNDQFESIKYFNGATSAQANAGNSSEIMDKDIMESLLAFMASMT